MKKLLYSIIIGLFLISCQSSSNKPQEILKSEKPQERLKFKIAEKKDISFMNTSRMVYRIILEVDSLPTINEMKNTAAYIWGLGGKFYDEFTTFLYLPGMDAKSMAYGVGEFNPKGIVRFFENDLALISVCL